ncbi:transcription initiation factor TFIIE, beta subunit [Xylona heveae TC161]|uniref:Transcription initiation factor IIE subunit beta n=1 Tax=Xylona heveae (strain CBS 132557 / TC161) TaxID=1328760 RepID=A0A165IHU0_XYLHT|nr:transcription initiation factor TFIIE, beta subunit [Xylona heveae TC161]KZF24920.1 transcription initiation factor TFIIE, beta subunit [Xylona heveae TC161]
MSYLQNQLKAFKSDLTSSSAKLSTKRSVNAPATSTPSPSPSVVSAASKNDLKRKRPDGPAIVYSQPADTGTGKHIMTQVTYAVDYLKSKDKPQTLKDIFSYLSLQHAEESNRKSIGTILKNHEKVEYDRNGANGEGTFRFKPIHNIRSKDELLRFLQTQPTAQGLSVRELKDGWPGAVAAIDQLEDQGRLLVIRNKKDAQAKMVWANDPSLAQTVDREFQDLWHKIKLPTTQADLAGELEKAGLTPTSKAEVIKVKPKKEEKKRKTARKGGRTTNTHMLGVLRDYSHLKK